MGIETATLAFFGRQERQRKAAETKQEKKAAAQSIREQELSDASKTPGPQRNVGRAGLIATTSRGLLNPERTGRKRLTAG